jgi:hypothetical protein
MNPDTDTIYLLTTTDVATYYKLDYDNGNT